MWNECLLKSAILTYAKIWFYDEYLKDECVINNVNRLNKLSG